MSAHKVGTIRKFPHYYPNTEFQASCLTQFLGLPKNPHSGTPTGSRFSIADSTFG